MKAEEAEERGRCHVPIKAGEHLTESSILSSSIPPLPSLAFGSNGKRKERRRAHPIFISCSTKRSLHARPGKARSRGRGAHGSEASSSRSNAHTSFAAYEFFVDLNCHPHSRLPLQDSFAMALVDSKPAAFGCRWRAIPMAHLGFLRSTPWTTLCSWARGGSRSPASAS